MTRVANSIADGATKTSEAVKDFVATQANPADFGVKHQDKGGPYREGVQKLADGVKGMVESMTAFSNKVKQSAGTYRGSDSNNAGTVRGSGSK
ncbi:MULTISPECIES: hypothetical protein [unclassified Crossiella]|uniref:hypothetical protein n=1 Tax=unclassified Crossiella TaxID=2620835 RepID=UPI00207CA4CA|nr:MULTISPECIES: hypothetical protein [unclassified Crossiella]MCO1576481.1 hypothetical protein [Crossiella sp. SN42]WHT18865.1 hypothetical protein N8J89_38155 [Crossiella sp. CA-258035]